MAGRIRDRLHQVFPGRVFLDVNNIDPGADFLVQINQNLDQCPLLIVLIGREWLSSTEAKTRLGDRDDYVTREIETALERGVPILPILVNGATVPDLDQIPSEGLKSLLKQNMLDIRHNSFERDCDYLIEKIYPYLDILPPTRLELLMEGIVARFGNDQFRYDERMRGVHAILGVFMGVMSVLMTVFLVIEAEMGGSGLVDLEMMFLTFCGIFPGLIGKNSRRRRRMGWIGLILCAGSLFLQFVLINYYGILGY